MRGRDALAPAGEDAGAPIGALGQISGINMEAFAEIVEEFCKWVESEPGEPQGELMRAVELVARLYAGFLPRLHIDADYGDYQHLEVDRHKLQKRFAVLPVQYYWETLAPLPVDQDAKTGMGDICDDLMDIYGELKNGLELWQRGEREAAMKHWKSGFVIHWGEHAVSSMQTLHWALFKSK
jgi:hypothetical protein